MGLLPFSVKAIAEAKVAIGRLKVGLIHRFLSNKIKDHFLSFIPHCQRVPPFPCEFVPLAPLSALIKCWYRTY